VRTTSLVALLAMLTSSCASNPPAVPPRVDPPAPTPGSLVAIFTECVGVLGPTRDLPVASAEVLEGPRGARVELPAEGLVMDGYRHWLYIHPTTHLVYIVQVGGFAGFLTVFGPFNREDGCRAVPPPDQVPWFWDLAARSGRRPGQFWSRMSSSLV
jgi:hypothetical protein